MCTGPSFGTKFRAWDRSSFLCFSVGEITECWENKKLAGVAGSNFTQGRNAGTVDKQTEMGRLLQGELDDDSAAGGVFQ